MTPPTPVGYLDFFILEASDYVEQLDAVLLRAGSAAPDSEALQRVGRALRGSATMAKLSSFSELAAGIERVGRSLREGALAWDTSLQGALVSAVDDCKVLLHSLRSWGDADERRARGRIDELTRYAPVRGLTPLSSPSVHAHDGFIANEAANIGAGLELLATRPIDRDAAVNVLKRVRALRGIASIRDYSSLADVLEASERAAHPLELGVESLGSEQIAVLATAATVLRGLAASIRTGMDTDAASTDMSRFAAALDVMQERETGTDRVIPIAELFYSDGGPTIVERSAHPPTTPTERFGLEVVSQAEHLRRLVDEARNADDTPAQERVRRDLRQALRSLRLAAESFGEHDTAFFIASHMDSVVRLDRAALTALEEVATLLSHPALSQSDVGQRVDALRVSRTSSMTPIASIPALAQPGTAPEERLAPAAARVAVEAASAVSTSTGRTELLDAGIDRLGALARTPLAAPAPTVEQPPVPIEKLLYRGRSAIERCVELRDEMKLSGGPVDSEALDELFALLDLALTS